MDTIENKDLNYWKKNAEEDYMQVPISVLRYISELEEVVKNCSIPAVVGQSEQLVCPDCKLPFTKEELQIKEHCFNCGMITTELTIELQKEILKKMFGFTLVDESDSGEPHYVVYDEDGNEFYGSNENCKYDLSTFGGIIRYAEDRGYKMGYLSCQMDMRKVLGIS